MVEVPQIQYIDKVVDAPVEMQPAPEMEHVSSTLATEWEASTPHVVDSSLRKRKSSGSLQSPRARAGMRTHVQDDDIRHEIFHVNLASADEMEEAASVHALTSIRTPSELDDVKLGMAHVKEDLKEVRKMLEFLVCRERKVDTQTEVATRRLERLGREKRRGGPGARSEFGGSTRGQDQSRKVSCRQMVYRQRLWLWQSPNRRDCLHSRKHCGGRRSPDNRNRCVGAGRERRCSSPGEVSSQTGLGTRSVESGEGQKRKRTRWPSR